jgi:D-threonate/D-erythronate kinase
LSCSVNENKRILSKINATLPMPALNFTFQDIPSLPAQASQRVHVIADDLTGACDAAAAFLPQNSVRIWLGSVGEDADETVQAFNTDTRNASPAVAAKLVFECALRCPPGALLFKKIDSAARGPIAPELLAAQQAFGADIILFTPSFPLHGRIVSGGILHVYPASGPRTRLSLATLFSPEDQLSIAIVTKPADFAIALASEKRIAICDGETDEELQALVRFAADLPKRILYAGSAGLAHALASLLWTDAPQPRALLPAASNQLLIVGTNHPVTQLQLEHLKQHHPNANLLSIRCDPSASEKIQACFAELNPQTLVLTGGDTALLALRALGACSIKLRGEIATGIPWGIIDGGLAHQRTVVTKSGGFGAANTLREILTTLAGHA